MAGCELSNKGFTQTEPLISVNEFRNQYLFGVPLRDPVTGNDIPDSVLQAQINGAVSWLEHDLELAIMPRECVEEKDHHANDYNEWGFFQLNHYPLIEVKSLVLSYLRDQSGAVPVQEIPKEWFRVDHRNGLLRLVPNNNIPASLQIGSAGTFYPQIFQSRSFIPQVWIVTYTHGFKEGCIPSLVNQAIALLAAQNVLSILGNIALGAGVSGFSIGMDGLSQSIQLSQSAEYSAYSSFRKEYNELLFGKRAEDPAAIMTILRKYYRGVVTQIV